MCLCFKMHRDFKGFDMGKSLYFSVRWPTYMLEMKNLIIYSFMQSEDIFQITVMT